MKILLSIFTSIVLVLLLITSAHALTLAWDPYSDTVTTDLRIYTSIDKTTWSILVDSIPADEVASEIPDNLNDYERVYYMMRAYDSVNDEESGNSNVVSYFWTSGGSGHTGPAGVGGVRLLDCSSFDAIPDDGSAEWTLCNDRHNKP